MEPVSIFGVMILSAAAGAMLSLLCNKGKKSCCSMSQEQQPIPEQQEQKLESIIDPDRERAIDELIAKSEHHSTSRRGA
jgi:hypothetical protein